MKGHSKQTIQKILYIPLEIFSRELNGGLILANTAIKMGWLVILGGKHSLFANLPRFKEHPGVFYLKSIVPGELELQKKIVRDGHRVSSLDVEFLVPGQTDKAVRQRYSDETLDLCDFIFCWGENHYKRFNDTFPLAIKKVHITGSPIIDSISRISKINTNRDQNTPFTITIGSSCSRANNIAGKKFVRDSSLRTMGGNYSDEWEEFWLARESLNAKMLELWLDYVPRLSSQLPNARIIFRPHPVEDPIFWEIAFKELSNVHIDKSSDVVNVLCQTDVFLHINSTTAVTSNIMNIPTIMPLPKLNNVELKHLEFVKNISRITTDYDELISCIEGVIKKPQNDSDYLKFLSYYCENLKPGSTSASELIIQIYEKNFIFDGFDKTKILKNRNVFNFHKFQLTLKRNLLLYLGPLIKLFSKNIPLPSRNALKLGRAKQPPLTVEDIRQSLDFLEFDEDVNIIEFDSNLFMLDKSSS